MSNARRYQIHDSHQPFRCHVLMLNCEFSLPGFDLIQQPQLGFHSTTACCFECSDIFDPIAADSDNHGQTRHALRLPLPTNRSISHPKAPTQRSKASPRSRTCKKPCHQHKDTTPLLPQSSGPDHGRSQALSIFIVY